jgi:hypothetical protein
MAFDLAKDPGEEHPTVPDKAQTAAIAELTGVARQPALGHMTAGGSDVGTIAYLGSGAASGTPVLPDDENAKLPSPYDRMDLLRKFDAACGLVSSGNGAAGLAELEEILRADPGNLQAAFWCGRALQSMTRLADAAAAYRRAFEIGFRDPRCVAMALNCSLLAVNSPQAGPAAGDSEWTAASAFLVHARGTKEFRDDASTLVMEAALWMSAGHVDVAKAAEALDRAERAPGAESQRDRIRGGRDRLETLRK